MSRFLSLFVLIAAFVALSACSALSRRNSASVEDETKAATPLDVPTKPAADATPQTNSGPQVTLVKKDGTVLNADGTPMTTNKPATTEEVPNKMPITGQMTANSSTTTDTAAAAVNEAPKTWSYSGETGPDHWADMSSDNSLCQSGKMQSPIDLKWHKPVKGAILHPSYKASKAFVTDNGHAIQMAFDMGGGIKINGQTYDLMQVHFHSPSEHTLSGKHFPLEAHFVHKNADGKTVVLAAFYKEGRENAMLTKIWNAIPNPPSPASSTDLEISARDMMPPMRTYYEYTGSMTTPPCKENVRWMVFNTPMTISQSQLEALHHFHADNNRPIQPLNDRKVVNH
jgi:carbonic anhydrase